MRRSNANPEFIAKRAAGIARHASTPEGKAMAAAGARKLNATYWARPENKERHREHGRRQYANVLSRPEVRARNAEAVSVAVKKRFARMFDWLPDHYRDEYRHLIRSKKMTAAEAKAAIKAKIARDRKVVRQPLSFEEKLALVQQGKAQVVRKITAPQKEYEFSLGGVQPW